MAINRISDPDVKLLVEVAGILREDYPEDDPLWEGSPFAWIRKGLPPRSVGAIGEKLVHAFFTAKGFNVTRSPDRDSDRIISGLRTEIKFSTPWEGRAYRFQQIRDQNYDVVVCLGVSPFNAHCWVLPKSFVMDNWGTDRLPVQHGGRRGSDTVWLAVDPNDAPAWLSQYGGTLASAAGIMNSLVNP